MYEQTALGKYKNRGSVCACNIRFTEADHNKQRQPAGCSKRERERERER
jgi:hypothetical protein